MLNIRLFKKVLLRVLRERTAAKHPRIGGRELYDAFTQQPEVISYRAQHHPESLVTETTEKEKGKKKALQDREKKVEPTVTPTRSFVRQILLPRLLQSGRIEKVHRKETASAEDIARLSSLRTKSGATLLSRYKHKPGQPIVLSKWYWRLVPPPPSYVVPLPRKPPILKLTATEELELRRKSGEFSHLNRRKQKRVMRNALFEISARQKKEKGEWEAMIDKLKKEHAQKLEDAKQARYLRLKEKSRLRRKATLELRAQAAGSSKATRSQAGPSSSSSLASSPLPDPHPPASSQPQTAA